LKSAGALVLLLALAACQPAGEHAPLPPAEETGEEAIVEETGEGTTEGGIGYRASSELREGRVEVRAELHNRGDREREVTFPDGCVVLIRAYHDAARSGPPAWDQRQHAICTMALVMESLQPGESRSFEMTVEVDELLGEQLPQGEYHLTAFLRPDGGEVEIPAGSLRLAR